MIGIDTNILVRYLAQDDPVQSKLANALFERQLRADAPGFISLVTLIETVWVLQRAYKLKAAALAAAIERILQAEVVVVEAEQEVFTAMRALKRGQGSFADALIAALGKRAGCEYTLTFDKDAARLDGFRLLR